MKTELSFISLFEQFIKDSQSGRRLKPNGERIKPQTIDNYRYVLKHLSDFQEVKGFNLRIKPSLKLNKKQLQIELNYWKKFYLKFADYLSVKKGCYDNYIGMVFKIVRVFFNYLKNDRLILTGDFHKKFYVRKEDVPIITLMPDQLQFLINDKAFEESLPDNLKKIKDVFVFGCTVALRCSDIFNLRFRDIETISGQVYLVSKSIKTESLIRVKLPCYAIEILNKYRKSKSVNSKIFGFISKNQINKNLRKLAEFAGWTQIIGKVRKQNGRNVEQYFGKSGRVYRFCDLVSSHVMRRTAITTMLMLGMPEHVVRKISGHTSDSKAFYRYVNFVQSYMDQEIDRVHSRLFPILST